MRTLIVLATTLAVAASAHGAAAQTYIVEPGTPYQGAAIGADQVLGSQMNGMEVLVRFGDGSTSGGTWGFLFESMGVARYGVRNTLFSLSVRGDADTGGPNPSVNDFNLANFNPSGETIVGFLLRGAPANVVFDRTFGGLAGTPGSGAGRDLVEANDPGGNEFRMTVRYRNLVGVGGVPPVGDLFESLDVTFGNPVPEGENYSLFLDTDLVRTLQVVPEPSTYALVGLGLAGLVAVRRRTR